MEVEIETKNTLERREKQLCLHEAQTSSYTVPRQVTSNL
uniref:Uncharacterized protein n=1 Tax=Anguilla anguilla TaxID=7936 RepID=A0A0E9RGW4_ANGAN